MGFNNQHDALTIMQIELAVVAMVLLYFSYSLKIKALRGVLLTLSSYYAFVALSDCFIEYLPDYMMLIETCIVSMALLILISKFDK